MNLFCLHKYLGTFLCVTTSEPVIIAAAPIYTIIKFNSMHRLGHDISSDIIEFQAYAARQKMLIDWAWAVPYNLQAPA